MSDVIAGLRRDLEQRLKDIERELAEHEPLLREREQIQARSGAAAVRASARPAGGQARARAQGGAAKRAPRGANREAILHAVGERPGRVARRRSPTSRRSRAR